MKNKLFNTSDSWSAMVLRIILGLVVFPHGAQKLLGWFDGFGFSATMTYFTDTKGLPWIIGFLVIILESFGAIALIAGIGTRIISALYLVLAVGIIFTSAIENGFFMNWFNNKPGEGYEYFILWIGISVALLLNGGGRYSADAWMVRSRANHSKPGN